MKRMTRGMNAAQAQPAASEDPFFGAASPQAQDGNELALYWGVLRKRWWAILLLTLMVGLVSWAVSNTMPLIFRSTATIMIEVENKTPVKIEDGVPVSPFGDNLQTQIEILKSRNVVMRTIEQLRLWEQPEFDPRKAPPAWKLQLQRWVGVTEAAPVAWTPEMLAGSVFGAFMGRIDTQIVPGSRLVKVSFDAQDADLAAKVANAWVQVYIAEDQESRFRTAQSVTDWVQSRADELQKNVAASERALQDFRERNNLVKVNGGTEAVSTRQMEELTPRVVEARVRLTQLDTAYKQMQLVTDGDYTTVPWVMSYGTVPDARARETTARFKVAELAQNYGYEHPKMVQAQAELVLAKEYLRRQTAVAAASLTREFETASATLKALNGSLSQERGQSLKVNRSEFQLAQLESEAEANRQLYKLFMSRGKQLDVVADIEKTVARVIDPALPVRAPVAPNKPKMILASVLLGLFGALAVALAIELLDNTIKGSNDAEKKLSYPVVTSLPVLKDAGNSPNLLEYQKVPGSVYSEAIRTARTSLTLSALDDERKVFMITSSSPGEGKTTVAANLALALAQGSDVLLIEADMRRPRFQRLFALPEACKGLSNLVAGTTDLADCLHMVAEGSRLVVLPAGDTPTNPLELLMSRRFERVLTELQADYDYILIDTPPVEAVSDAIAISHLTSGAVFVVQAEETSTAIVKSGLKKLERANVNVLGLVLNQVNFESAKKYYGEYEGYGSMGYKSASYGAPVTG
ncbi:polysaccharide biosynthesis tyrosine autokinase [Rhodoferax sp.]|uniref:GumC family protein n=1 Tax=Rhodoferax sp. TaxID=50421 RepID=UPI00260362D5|nr:polysaccharide biosynthesis tyrosine autokinase [Rhodoferax sp.]MDD3935984.1 polysaccharide biosynthesis tyrosine autokinase [Rhodoferax sp.]